jgi:hypothetical protein
MPWTLEDDDAEDAYWRERRTREREQERTNPHTLERWFRRSVQRRLTPEGAYYRPVSEAVLDWYWENRDRFLVWKDYETYAGEGYASGEWVIDVRQVRACILLAELAGDPEQQMEHFLARVLTDKDGYHRDAKVPTERAACSVLCESSDLPLREQERRLRKLKLLRDRWPRACDQCGDVFVPSANRRGRKVTTCETCKPWKSKGTKSAKSGQPTTTTTKEEA